MWFLYASLGALCIAGHYAFLKHFLRTEDKDVLAAAIFLSAALLLFSFSWYRGFPHLHDGFWQILLIAVVFDIVAIALTYRALEVADFSLVMPLLALTPIFLIATSWLLLGEIPTRRGVAGIVLIVVGAYILGCQRHHTKRLRDPLIALASHHGVRLMMLVALIYSIGPNFNKLLVLRSDPMFGQAMASLFVGIAYSMRSVAKGNRMPSASLVHIFLAASLLASSAILVNIAFTMTNVAYAISVKRMSILFSILLGGVLFKEQISIRIVAGLIMIVGAVLIAFS